MATTGDGRAACESGGAEEKYRKRLFRPEINEDTQNVSQEAGRNNSTGASELSTHQGGNFASISVTVGKSELEQMLKQMTFTRSEAQCLVALVHSRTIEESPTPFLRLEASTTGGSLKKHKHGDERDNVHASVIISRVLKEKIASPAELANDYEGSTSGTGQALRQDLKLINVNATCLSKSSVASLEHPTTMENLSDEILSNIFIRLLAKQLAQMRSVSKSWNALLSQSSFIKSHLHRSIHNNDQILLVFYYYEKSFPDFKPFAAFLCRSPHLELSNFIKLPVNTQPEYTNGISIIGSVNGLICSSFGDSVIHIWNPSLSAVLTLPPYSMPSGDYDSITIDLRFGFDPKTNDYKVVKLTGLTGPTTYAIKWWLQIEIYSMRKGTWELITERYPSHITHIFSGDYVCADGRDGHLHWLCCTNEEFDSKTIVAFDLGSETFREIPLPHSTLDHNRSNVLGVLAGKLCVMSQLDDVFEVWVMSESRVAESWVKHHVFSQLYGSICPFGFSSHNEFLIENDGSLVLYDPIANKQKVIKDYCPFDYGALNIVEYVDSLVWVAPVDHEMVDDGGQN